MSEKKTRQLAAVMFTDIVGYTALMQGDEEVAMRVRSRHREVMTSQHKQYRGEIIQYYGDGSLSVFRSAIEAVQCAIEIQRQLQQGEQVVPIRIGLHMGDIVHSDTEVYGDGVNFASRIESMSVVGAVLLSSKLNDELKNHPSISTQSVGYFELKNISDPVEVFAVTNDGIKVPARSDLKGKHNTPSKTIAVLPFVNMSSNADNEYFSDGMTEEIINALARVKGLKVTSRTSSFFFKNKNIPITQIGRELNVSTILEGSVRLSGNKMRITAQLINVENDFHFWSDTFDRSIEDVFEVQDEISLLIADKLREHVGHLDIADHLIDTPDLSVDLYKRYLKGRYHVLKMSKPDFEKGITIFKEIIAEQPDFALGYIGVHLGYMLLGTLGYIPAVEAFTEGAPYLEKAIKINPDLPECQLNLSYASLLQEWDLEATYKHLNRAFELRPSVEYYQSMASVLVIEGKFEAALNYIDIGIQLDPFSDINYHLKGFIYYTQQEYELSIEMFEKSVKLKPGSQVSIFNLGQSLILLGRSTEALEYFEQLSEEPDDLMKWGGIALANAALGKAKYAQFGVDKLEAALETDAMERALNLLQVCHTKLGNYERAIELIEVGVNNRVPMMLYLAVEPVSE